MICYGCGCPTCSGHCRAGPAFALRYDAYASRRAGGQVAVPLEDLGVEADRVHELTRRDITERNQDLLAAAGNLLLG